MTIVNGEEAAPNSIFITLDSSTKFQDVAGRNTSEGYKLSVTNDGITIAGASPLGAWWGTRSVLQAAVLNTRERNGSRLMFLPKLPFHSAYVRVSAEDKGRL